MGSSSAGEYNWCAYDAETSKKIEMYFVAMGPDRFECDVGGGRVVTKTSKGLVQHVKGEPGRWRAVRRILHGPGATHSPAPPPSLAPAAPAAPALLQQLQSAVTYGRTHHVSFGQDERSDDEFQDDKASKAFKQKRAAAHAARAAAAAERGEYPDGSTPLDSASCRQRRGAGERPSASRAEGRERGAGQATLSLKHSSSPPHLQLVLTGH